MIDHLSYLRTLTIHAIQAFFLITLIFIKFPALRCLQILVKQFNYGMLMKQKNKMHTIPVSVGVSEYK